MQEIAEEKIHEGFYTLGESEEQLLTTCKEINVNMLARKIADIDAIDGRISSTLLEDYRYINSHYRKKAYAPIDAILQEQKNPENYITRQDRIVLDKLKANDTRIPAQTRRMDALEGYIKILNQLRPFYNNLKKCHTAEMDAVIRTLNDGYAMSSSGGDPIVNPAVIPTGCNLYGVNADKTPDEEAWRIGRQIGELKKNMFAWDLRKLSDSVMARVQVILNSIRFVDIHFMDPSYQSCTSVIMKLSLLVRVFD